ncbi:PAS domain-containing sensor histidine kinase [Ferribacterium limneticum]|uniref:PAS domain-containing sensor histidine kinase n=1 Tax=Ferribacterium limneticum TaxID=76259 RepID=UPI001CFC03F9|nr:ATP-binding protein [Ferribacterium limneticum]UCV28266.1 PAS domain-containing protein [Ferribacterium limneticum]UCV32183.1 PAS domain-containing protein [Ferribacterium limneticum]
MSTIVPPADLSADSPLPPGGEQAWIEVIQKMDEVYNDLLQYEVALEEKNAALEESHQFIESVLASMSDILIVCDRNGGIEEVNSSLQHFSGKTAGELEKTPVFDLFADDVERAKARDIFARYGRKGVHDCEFFLRAGDGSTVPVSMNCTPRLSQTGKLMGMVVTGRPVGELRRAYSALRQAHDDLKRTQGQLLHAEKMVSLGRLVAGVAHELNNPISFVLGNVLSLKRYASRLESYLGAVHASDAADDGALKAMRQELRIDRILADMPHLIDGMIEGAERTRDIVDALKRFSAVDKMTPERVSLNEVVERSVRWVVQSASAKFAVDVDLPPDLQCSGSSGQLQQVVMNLVQNASDAVANRADPRLSVTGSIENGMVTLRFTDNGPGIPEEHLSRLFEPFFTTKPVGQGTGLGLSISYGIVERHGGKLSARNVPGNGAEFILALPVESH